MRLFSKIFSIILVLYILSIIFVPPVKAGCGFNSSYQCTGTCSCPCGGSCYCGVNSSGHCVPLGCNTNCCQYNCRKYPCNSNEDQVSGSCAGTDMVCCKPKPQSINTPRPSVPTCSGTGYTCRKKCEVDELPDTFHSCYANYTNINDICCKKVPTSTPAPQPTDTPIPINPPASRTATSKPTDTPNSTTTSASTLTPACSKKTSGDANCDGKIDGVDYSMWLNRQCNSGCANENLKADFNGDNKVNDDDYSIWFNNRQ